MRPATLRSLGAACLLLGGLGLVWAQDVQLPTPERTAQLERLQAEIDAAVEQAFEDAAGARAALAELAVAPGADPIRAHLLLLARGLVAVEDDDEADVSDVTARLLRAAEDPLTAGHVQLIRASLADHHGDTDSALKAAAAATEVYRRFCPASPGCDYRTQMRAELLLSRHESRRGQLNAALEDASAALQLARIRQDPKREALALGQVADVQGLTGDVSQGARLIAEAQRVARTAASLPIQARLYIYAQRDAERRHDMGAALHAAEMGLAIAREGGLKHLIALMQANLADVLVKTGAPKRALTELTAALPVARQYHDQRLELLLEHNETLARIALGDTLAARRTLDQILTVQHRAGALAVEADALTEFADAFANVGDFKNALELFHRERRLTAEIMAANRDATLAQLRTRYDREAQQRQVEQLGRENALMSAQLANRDANNRVWIGGALLLVLAMVLVALLYRRVMELNRALAVKRDFLRAQSLRDPLTGLANRRSLYEQVEQVGISAAFEGVLLLIDVDHFKRVNDQFGHAAGDRVLVELAQRLSEVVRANDLVLRWGGEEFLVFMPAVGAPQAHDLAQRILQVIGSSPVPLAGDALRVTVSIGYASFPLPDAHLPLSLERAINLADMALYTAKSEGRNCAIGLEAVTADDIPNLRAVEADFDQAVHEGKVRLRRTGGPAVPLSVVASRGG